MVKRKFYHRIAGLLVFWIFGTGLIGASPVFNIHSEKDYWERLNSCLDIWHDSLGVKTFPELDTNDFQPLIPGDLLPKQGAIWGHIRLKNLNKAISNWVLEAGKGTYAELWIKIGDRWTRKKSGQLVPVSEVEIAQGLPYHCKFFLDLPYGQETDIFIKISHKFNNPSLNFKLIGIHRWQLEARNRDVFQGLLHGMSLIMLLFNLFYFVFSKDRTYLYYAFYILAGGLYFFHWQGYMRIYLVPELPFIDPYFALLSSLMPVSYLPFMRSMVDAPRLIPDMDKWIKRLLYFGLTLSAVSFLMFIFADNARWVYKFVNLAILIEMGFIFIFIRRLYKTRSRLVQFFIMGVFSLWLPALAGIIIFVVSEKAIAVELAQTGMAMELLIFALGLGYRSRLNETARKHAQDQLIVQLRENERLQAQTQEELEEKVKSRTIQLEREKDKALKASRAKEEFLSIMSHEIRTPMNAVIGMTNILLMEKPRVDQTDNLNILKFSAENLLSLINDILDYSKIEAGRIELEKLHFQPSELLTVLIKGNEVSASVKGIELILDISPDIPEWLVGDPTRLVQVLNNLVSNAIKFTYEGRVTLKLEVKSLLEEKVRLRFSIIDTGVGIAPENHHKIFETFTQEQSSTTREFGGTGLGLAITQKLLKLHNSEIELKSTKGEGATFSFEIEYMLGNKSGKESQAKVGSALQSPEALTGIRVLVVEDNPVNAKIAGKFFEKWGMKTDFAVNGKEALEILENKDFDLVVMDLQMPVMDGYEASRHIRHSDKVQLRNIPIIALTASALLDVEKDVLDAGMNDWMAKPFKPGELFQKIQSVMKATMEK